MKKRDGRGMTAPKSIEGEGRGKTAMVDREAGGPLLLRAHL